MGLQLLNIVVLILAITALTTADVAKLREDLLMLQQNSYRNERYMRWLRSSGDTTSWSALASYVVFLGSFAAFSAKPFIALCMAVFGMSVAWSLIRRRHKKPLVMTQRAKRLFCTQLILMTLVAAAFTAVALSLQNADVAYYAAVGLTGVFCVSHVLTMAANIILGPVEKHINNRFYRMARQKLQSMPGLIVVGITGSYGKTSTKHYLHRILSEKFDTLITPGSYNTTLGVVRTINEYLKPYNQVFVCEMGAKQRNDIAEICRLVQPKIGIVTAVGPQHLETFGTVENVRDTKFELVDALPKDGLAVLNNDSSLVAGRPVDNCQTVRFCLNDATGAGAIVTDINCSATGTEFTVTCGDWSIRLQTKLLGDGNISDLTAAVLVARKLGVDDNAMRYAVSRIEQVEHRLSTRLLGNGTVLIDDAFNSNPAGSAMALDVLSIMGAGKKIVITPGMIELGAMQYELNLAFGQKIARVADVVMIVGQYNRQAIKDGIEAADCNHPRVLCFDSFQDAFAEALKITTSGDAILIENDLPDTFK